MGEMGRPKTGGNGVKSRNEEMGRKMEGRKNGRISRRKEKKGEIKEARKYPSVLIIRGQVTSSRKGKEKGRKKEEIREGRERGEKEGNGKE